MAGKKRGTPGVKQPGEVQLFSWGTRAGNLKALIVQFARDRGITDMREAANRYLEYQATHKADHPAGYARGVQNVEVVPLDGWPKEGE